MAATARASALKRSPSGDGLARRLGGGGGSRAALRPRRGAFLLPAVPAELSGAAALVLKMAAAGRAALALAPAGDAPADGAPAPAAPAASAAAALDVAPRLSRREELGCLLLAAALCAAIYAACAPPAPSLAFAAGIAGAAAAALAAAREALLEREYASLQRSERELAGPGALFARVEGTALHYTRVAAPGVGGAGGAPPNALAHLLHGFGANTASWRYCAPALAAALGGIVSAHDIPGFGLSERPAARRFYSLAFNGRAAGALLGAEAAAAAAAAPAGAPAPARVLVGHSMGGAAAAEALIRRPGGYDALVLVAPAIVASWTSPPARAAGDAVATAEALLEELVSAEDPPGSLGSASSVSSADDAADSGSASSGGAAPAAAAARAAPRRRRRALAAAAARAVAAELARLALVCASPLLAVLLRRLVRARAFWERGLAAAYSDPRRMPPSLVDEYRMPQLVRGFEAGLFRFVGARLSERAGLWAAAAAALAPDGHLPQAARLAAAVAAHGTRVLIVHGADDALVPPGNSRRLARLLPGAQLLELPSCGHCPHEELPEEFARAVAAFVAAGAAP
jgi:pimeloyl-ACP methyl ester carboxylesterase